MPYFRSTDRADLFYADEGTGRTILFVHGWYADLHFYDEAVEILKADYRCVRYDLRCHGQSASPVDNRTIEQLGEDLNALITQLDLDHIMLVTHSMGGLAAFAYINKYGCNKLASLIIMDMSPKPLPEEDWEFGAMNIDADDEHNLDAKMANQYVASQFSMLEPMRRMTSRFLPFQRHMEQMMPRACFDMYPTAIMDFWLEMLKADYREMLPKITIPVLYAKPESSVYPEGTGEYILEHISAKGQFREWNYESHVSMADDPKDLIAAVHELEAMEEN